MLTVMHVINHTFYHVPHYTFLWLMAHIYHDLKKTMVETSVTLGRPRYAF
jgi:hypothetical protein